MYRSKEFMLMNVEDSKGKKIGVIKDLLLNFKDLRLTGFVLSTYSIFKKDEIVSAKDIIAFNEFMIVNKLGSREGVPLSKIKNLDVIDICGTTIGVVEDFLFCVETFRIKALVVSTGMIKNLFYGKRVILPTDFIIGDESVIYYPKNKNISMISKIHTIGKEDEEYECR